MFFDVCKNVIGDIQDIQADEKNPDDCSKDPHDVTHTVDGVRYYCISRVLPAEAILAKEEYWEDDDEGVEDYDSFMRGGEITADYLM
jgi:phage terminase large subunit